MSNASRLSVECGKEQNKERDLLSEKDPPGSDSIHVALGHVDGFKTFESTYEHTMCLCCNSLQSSYHVLYVAVSLSPNVGQFLKRTQQP